MLSTSADLPGAEESPHAVKGRWPRQLPYPQLCDGVSPPSAFPLPALAVAWPICYHDQERKVKRTERLGGAEELLKCLRGARVPKMRHVGE